MLAGIAKAKAERVYDVGQVEALIAATLAKPHKTAEGLAVPQSSVVQQPPLADYDRLLGAAAGVTA